MVWLTYKITNLSERRHSHRRIEICCLPLLSRLGKIPKDFPRAAQRSTPRPLLWSARPWGLSWRKRLRWDQLSSGRFFDPWASGKRNITRTSKTHFVRISFHLCKSCFVHNGLHYIEQLLGKIISLRKASRHHVQNFHAVLSSNMLPSCTEEYAKYPMASHAILREVPTFMREKLEHFTPRWDAKSPGMQRRTARIASLGYIRASRVYSAVWKKHRIPTYLMCFPISDYKLFIPIARAYDTLWMPNPD